MSRSTLLERLRALLPQRVEETLASFSPGRRRWKRFLRELPLDPAQLPDPLPAPSPRDFIICGMPRSGTTLLSAMLYQPPAVVTVMEPWDGMRMPPAPLFGSLRSEIKRTGRLTRGQLDVEALLQEGAVRWCKEGEARPRVDALKENYLLGVKWPAFYHYLSRLPDTKFLVCVRDPYEVVSSAKNNGGRLGKGLQYETAFNRELNAYLEAATSDRAVRRVLLYEYINARIVPFLSRPNVFAVQYERWFQEPDTLLAEISAFLGTTLDRSNVEIHASKSPLDLTRREVTLIQKHGRSAKALGYDLASSPRAVPS